MGTPDFAVAALDALCRDGQEVILAVTQPDRQKGRGRKVIQTPVKICAEKWNVPVFQPVRIREPEAIEKIRALAPDLIVVAAFGQILPQELLDIPRLGCINIHASLLPKLRGAAPIQWSVINGDSESGITLMQMNSRFSEIPVMLASLMNMTKPVTSAASATLARTESGSPWKTATAATGQSSRTKIIKPRRAGLTTATNSL